MKKLSDGLGQELPDISGMPKKSYNSRPVPKWVAFLLAVLTVVLVAVGAGSYAVNRLEKNITVIDTGDALKPEPTPSVSVAAKEPLTFALLGSDTRVGQGAGYGNFGGARADTTLIVHVNAARTNAAVLSIPRDLWIKLPNCMVNGKNVGGYYSKFNAAYAFGGPECAIMAITETFGINVQHVIVADFKGFKTVVNALGGVEVCLAEAAYDKSSKLDLPAGRQTISGEDALAFVRARKGIADGSDISRSERQKMFLGSIIRTAEQSGLLTDPVRLYKVLDAATKSLSMDEELASIGALSGLALEIKSVGSKNIQFVALPWKSRGDGSIELTSAADAILEAFRSSTLPILDLSKKVTPAASASPSASASGKPGIPTGTPSPSPSALLGFDASQDPCSKPIK